MSDAPEETSRAVTDAHVRGLQIDIRERAEASSLAEAAHGLGLEPDGIVKSLVVRRGAGDYVFVLLAAGHSMSWPLLRTAAGANRMTLPDAAEAFAATGYERGTISPIGSTTAWPVFLDSSVASRIAIGSGSRRHTIVVDSGEFARAYEATVIALRE
ncbi:MAG TPA: YbaK/EbsC family protein [Nocardioidaceae bacterium]|nr:YbaK/EbsC family protein [Nocardioidaceae bacterium]